VIANSVKESVAQAIDAASDARGVLASAELAAAPYVAAIEAADSDFRRVELETSAARMQDRLAQLARDTMAPELGRGLGI
jgi:cell division protein FtsL